MIRLAQRRRRDRKRNDPAVPMVVPSSPPTGPAGGDLSGDYPNPSVASLAHVAAGGALSGMMDAPSVNSIDGIAASGDLSGNYPAPTVSSIAHVTTGPAVYPAGSGALLTNLPAPATLRSGSGVLNGAGVLSIDPGPAAAVIAGWANGAGTGVLFNNTFSSIQSTAGAADAGMMVNWIAF